MSLQPFLSQRSFPYSFVLFYLQGLTACFFTSNSASIFLFHDQLRCIAVGSLISSRTSSRRLCAIYSTLTFVWYAILPTIPAQVFCGISVGEEFIAKVTNSATESQAELLTPEMAEQITCSITRIQ